MIRFSHLLFTLTLIASSISTAEANQRRPGEKVEPGVALSGKITEAGSSAAVSNAVLTIGNVEVTADRSGIYKVAKLPTGAKAVEVNRWGYATRKVPLNSRSGNTLNISLQPRPVATVTTIAGKSFPVDFDMAAFQANYPMMSAQTVEPLTVCQIDGSRVEIAIKDVKGVDGPGVPVTGSPCCPEGNAVRVTLRLRSGSTSEILLPECDYYKVSFHSRNRQDGTMVDLKFDEIARIEFP